MPITLDDQFRAMNALIDREKKWVADNRTKYGSSFLARKDHEIELYEAIRETVRQARQNQQMTGMSGRRIDEGS